MSSDGPPPARARDGVAAETIDLRDDVAAMAGDDRLVDDAEDRKSVV